MKNSFIWDLDGTIIDSYEIIVDNLAIVAGQCHLSYSQKEIYQYVKSKSVNAFIGLMANSSDYDKHQLKTLASNLNNQRAGEIKCIPHAAYVLDYLYQNNIQNFIYTHKGKSTAHVLENLNLTQFFKEVITSEYGFERKPHAQGIEYIVDKYKLNKDAVFYVGDRQIDADCAQNAGVKSIILTDDSDSSLSGDYMIRDLKELVSFM
ncbi:HAD-IA family hydrolase [Oceanobacillus neutriphilus]|uniref:Haloacid dehalogenase n=1 Tax=Oceanobacillus neutriphilus TaxID=531815 RepID=A0ABQ2P191_9BACI|nr:HAD-IA family hydrolase [Oceanobacillus neutriphilus]GGP15571.1 haloacid dehalogenase [Oceanobacillus neutriphilus]